MHVVATHGGSGRSGLLLSLSLASTVSAAPWWFTPHVSFCYIFQFSSKHNQKNRNVATCGP